MKWYRSVSHDDEWIIEDLIEQNDKLVVRFTGWMTYKGGWFNIPSNNQRIKETGIIIFKFKEGKRYTALYYTSSGHHIFYSRQNYGTIQEHTSPFRLVSRQFKYKKS